MTVEYDHTLSTVDFGGEDLWKEFRVRKNTAALTDVVTSSLQLDADGGACVTLTPGGIVLKAGKLEAILVIDLSKPAGLEMRGLRVFYAGVDDDPTVNALEFCVKADGTWVHWDSDEAQWVEDSGPTWGPESSLAHINDRTWAGSDFIFYIRITRADGESSPVVTSLWAATSLKTRNWDSYILRTLIQALESKTFHGRVQLKGAGSTRLDAPTLPAGYLNPTFVEAFGALDNENILQSSSGGVLTFSRTLSNGELVMVGFTFSTKVYAGESLDYIEVPNYPSMYLTDFRNNNVPIGGQKLAIPIQKTDMSQPRALTFSWPRSTALFATLGVLVDKYYDATSILGDIHDALDRAEEGLAIIDLTDTNQQMVLEDRGDIVDVLSQSNKLGVKAAAFPIRLGYPVPIPVNEEDMVTSFNRTVSPLGVS